jgi:phosphoglycolate phosphatase-like HAD superfamily hydrolase
VGGPTAGNPADFARKHSFFVGVDSDGCVFPTMEIKQKECFHPAIMDHWNLWSVEREVRRAAEWVNLYSVHRGSNRFQALAVFFNLLGAMPGVRAKGVKVRATADLDAFLNAGLPLDNENLAGHAAAHPSLGDILAWSRDIDRRVSARVRAPAPFPLVRESLLKLRPSADIMVVSATPAAALAREWTESGLAGLADLIAGQEAGSKRRQLAAAAAGRYTPGSILMVGDAPGDLEAAWAAGGLFQPICPGRESESWAEFYREGIERFLAGAFAGDYQRRLISGFQALLAKSPPWATAGEAA